MTNWISHENPRRIQPWGFILLGAVIVAGVLSAWGLAVRADKEMRRELLGQARLVAETINLQHVQTLSGTEADLDSPLMCGSRSSLWRFGQFKGSVDSSIFWGEKRKERCFSLWIANRRSRQRPSSGADIHRSSPGVSPFL